MGSEAIERLRFLASLPLAGTGQREGGKKTQPFNHFQSRLGIDLRITLRTAVVYTSLYFHETSFNYDFFTVLPFYRAHQPKYTWDGVS